MGGKSFTVGYRYSLGLQHLWTFGPINAVHAMYANQRKVMDLAVTESEEIYVDQPNLFGGDKSQGGLQGVVEFRMGEPTQMPSAYLEDVSGMGLPADRHLFTTVYRGSRLSSYVPSVTRGQKSTLFSKILLSSSSSFYWTANNPSLPIVEFDAERTTAGWSTPVLNEAKCRIADGDMNPIHQIFEFQTNVQWGSGQSSSNIDVANYTEVSDVLFDEGFGLSFLWQQQGKVSEAVKQILYHINAVRYVDPITAKWTIKLLREDYVVDDLLEFSFALGNILEIEKFTRRTWRQSVNQIVLIYCDPITDDDASCVVQDLANITIQGGVVSQTIRMPGIRQHALARRVAERELRAASSPLASMSLTVNRTGYRVRPGMVIKISYPAPLNLVDFLLRVLDVDFGQIGSGEIKISGAEDVFALPQGSYSGTQPPMWENPAGVPNDLVNVRVLEIPFFMMVQLFSPSELAALDPMQSYPLILAEKQGGIGQSFRGYDSSTPTPADFLLMDENVPFTPILDLDNALNKTDAIIEYVFGTPELYVDGFMLVQNEWMSIVSVDTTLKEITVKRGVLDSVPAAHAAHTEMWVYTGVFGLNGVTSDRVAGETVYYRETAASTSKESSITAAPMQTHTHDADWSRPYPAANVKIDGSYAPATITPGFTITWAGRNKELQTEDYVGWYEGHIEPTASTTYTIEVRDGSTLALLLADATLTAVGGGTYTYAGTTATSYQVSLWAVEGGRASKEVFVYTAPVL